MKKMMKLMMSSLLLLLLVAACQSGEKKEGEQKEIAMAYVDGWAAGPAMTYVVKEVLESKGYKVEVKKAAVDLIFASMAKDGIDVFMDTWLPTTHKEKVAKFEGKIVPLGVSFTHARIGLVVPQYVEVNSIEELNAHKSKFGGKIVGIEQGAGVMKKTQMSISEYGLDFELQTSSGVAMLSELKKAISKENWVVVTGWAPHWKFGRWNLKLLDDPKGVYGSVEQIETWSRSGFSNDDPFAAKFLKNFKLTDEQMGDLLLKMSEAKGKEAVIAKQWVLDNKELIASFLQ